MGRISDAAGKLGKILKPPNPSPFPAPHGPSPGDLIPPRISPADLVKAARDTTKAADDAAHALGKAVDEALHLPEKAAAELKRDLAKLRSARDRVTRAVVKAIDDVVKAGAALQQFSESELEDTFAAARKTMDGGNVFTSAWEFATSPIQNTNDNAMQALRESAVLAVVAQLAVSTYGGPAGSAAFSAWMAYNAGGGDLNMALRVGITQGLVAAATGAAGKLPIAQQAGAKAAIEAAMGKVQGKDSETVMQEALASLVTTSKSYLSVDELGAIQKSLVSAATGGLAVAAAGGDHNDVLNAFLKTGGKVLVQDVEAAAGAFSEQSMEQISAAVSHAIDPTLVEAVEHAYTTLKPLEDTAVAQALASARRAVAPYTEQAKAVNDVTRVQAETKRAELLAAIDTARAKSGAYSAQTAEQRKAIEAAHRSALAKVEGARQAAKAAAEKPDEVIEAEAREKIAALEMAELNGLHALTDQEAASHSSADREITAAKELLTKYRPEAVDKLVAAGQANAGHLAKNWVLSWDKAQLLAPDQPIGVVLTYAGDRSRIAAEIDRLADVQP